MATAMAIAERFQGGRRNAALRTDNQNVIIWAERAQSHSPVACRILRDLNLFCLHKKVDIATAYVRGGHN